MANEYNIEEIVQAVLSRMAAISQGVAELRTVTSLDGPVSLPALTASRKEVVDAPLSLLSQPAIDAAAAAQLKITAAQEKIELMATALKDMETLTDETTKVKTDAITATENAIAKLGEMSTLMQNCQALFDGLDAKDTLADDIIARVTAITAHAGELESRLQDDVQTASSFVSQLEAWAAAETARATAEKARKDAETARVSAENARAEAKRLRVTAETARVNVEKLRVQVEEARVQSEKLRDDAEKARKTAEEGRVSAEFGRVQAETAREQAKADSIALNTELKEHPPIISADGNWKIWDAVGKVYLDTETLARGKSPKPVNGTWWFWSDETKQYTDSGVSLNATYELTKAKIEAVFTGDITSHHHDSTYQKKVAGKGLSTNDFTTVLLQKLNGLSNYDDTGLRESLSNEAARAIAAEGTLQNAINTLRTNFETFIGGAEDADTVINRWQEVLAFLSGFTEDETLAAEFVKVREELKQYVTGQLISYYTKEQIVALLALKAEKEHTHSQYLTMHQDISHLMPTSGGVFTGNITAPSFIKQDGTAEQVLMANGSTVNRDEFSGGGEHEFSEMDDVEVQIGKVENAPEGWNAVTFLFEFYGIPSVSCSLIDLAGFVSVRNITASGFEFEAYQVTDAGVAPVESATIIYQAIYNV